MPDITTATGFLNTLNHAHPGRNDPFLDTQLLSRVPQIETMVYVKFTKTGHGLLLHYQSHVDNR